MGLLLTKSKPKLLALHSRRQFADVLNKLNYIRDIFSASVKHNYV